MLPSIFANSSNQGFFPTVFNDLFSDNWLMPQFHSTAPAINVSEAEKEYKVEVAAPGMTKDDFKISLADGDMVISMEKKNANDNANDKNRTYLRREFSYSKFEQRFALPDDIERQNISAKMTDGVLIIDLPKMKPEDKPQENQYIEIN